MKHAERKRMADLQWMVKRLRVMGPAEIVHRIGRQCALKVLAVRHRIGRRAPEPLQINHFEFCTGKGSMLPALPGRLEAGPDQINDLLAGKMKIGEKVWQWRPEGSVWHEAPDTGKVWPRRFFGSIAYRPGNPCGDIRAAWEPSRLQQLVGLGLLSKEAPPEIGRQAASLLEAQFLSWVEANPPLTGIHYISAMECALRLVAVCHALDLVRDSLHHPEQVWSALLRLVEGHAELIETRLSTHSSAGNHTLAEAVGLLYAGFLFPEMRRSPRWQSVGLALLKKEADHQILPDGGGVEQAFGYLRFGIDLYRLAIALLAHRHRPIPPILSEVILRGRRFLVAVADPAGRLPSVGDSDDGHALSPLLSLSHSEGKAGEGLTSFEEAGYSLIQSGPALLLFDHGPLGMLPLSGHGHADALSVILRVGRTDFLIDPGSFSYADPKWRSYFRGTAAHNTVQVDRQDQAVQEGTFIWSHPFEAKIIRREKMEGGGIRLLASHQGYRRDGVTHWRGIFFHPAAGWVIWDHLSGTGNHLLDLHWHLGMVPTQREGFFLLSNATEQVALSIEGGALSLHRGETEPILGWRSPAYGRKEPSSTIRARFEGTLPHTFLTRITLGPTPLVGPAMEEAVAEWKESIG
jgi:hypothetical protein